MELIDEGYIAVGGGCKVYLTGKMVLRPEVETVEVRIENAGRYFVLDHNPGRPIKGALELQVCRSVSLRTGGVSNGHNG